MRLLRSFFLFLFSLLPLVFLFLSFLAMEPSDLRTPTDEENILMFTHLGISGLFAVMGIAISFFQLFNKKIEFTNKIHLIISKIGIILMLLLGIVSAIIFSGPMWYTAAFIALAMALNAGLNIAYRLIDKDKSYDFSNIKIPSIAKAYPKISVGVVSVVIIILISSILSPSDSRSESTGSEESSGVPYRVEAEAMDILNLDPSLGAKIYSIEGNKAEEYPDGSERWNVTVEYRLTSNTGTKETSFPVNVDVP